MFDLKRYLESKRMMVEKTLSKSLSSRTRISEAMAYSLMAGGKRLRPVICMASAEAVGGYGENVLEAACAIEMIHTYSLIHDDLPAMDDDDLRRGKPTCHIAFDEATAILAGDALLTLAFQKLASIRSDQPNLLEAIRKISGATGYEGMIEGQMRDIAAEGTTLDLKDLEKIHLLKTGALIEASACCGALLGNGTSEQTGKLELYARNIGLAFQVADDILNVEGDPAVMGKAAGSDESRGKNTYPSLIGLKQSKRLARDMIDNALAALENFDEKSDPLRAIATYIIERKR